MLSHPSSFVGSVYRAFLSATMYHRWHSAVNEKVVKTVMIPRTYYAQSHSRGIPEPRPRRS